MTSISLLHSVCMYGTAHAQWCAVLPGNQFQTITHGPCGGSIANMALIPRLMDDTGCTVLVWNIVFMERSTHISSSNCWCQEQLKYGRVWGFDQRWCCQSRCLSFTLKIWFGQLWSCDCRGRIFFTIELLSAIICAPKDWTFVYSIEIFLAPEITIRLGGRFVNAHFVPLSMAVCSAPPWSLHNAR